MIQIEGLVLANLIENEPFFRKVFPFIKQDYFSEKDTRILFMEIENHATTYKAPPSKEALYLALDSRTDLKEENIKALSENIKGFQAKDSKEFDWLVNETEKWCKDRAIYNALMESVIITNDKTSKVSRNAIPEILSKALAVSFSTDIGHDYIENVDERLEFYHKKEDKIPFDLDYFNKITKDGVCKKTLNMVIAPSGKGKSMFLCHLAAGYLSAGYNVLYITLEMAEERIGERIDANLLDIPLNDIAGMPTITYMRKFAGVQAKTKGKLIIKEFPTASASTVHFRHLLDELKLKKDFVADIIIVDYLNICASARFKHSDSANSYMYIKSIAEELRGLAVERNVVIWSATQTNREGYNNTDPTETTVSESMGIIHTCDFLGALIVTDELDKINQVMFKQHKNRYNDIALHKRFVVGLDRPKMKFYDVPQPKLVDDNYAGGSSGLDSDDDDVGPSSDFGKKPKKPYDAGGWAFN